MVTIKTAFNWAVQAGITAVNPLAKVKKLPQSAEHVRHAVAP